MSNRVFIYNQLLLPGIILPLFFLYFNFKHDSKMGFLEELAKLQRELENFQICYEKSGISTKTTLSLKELEHKDKHEKVKITQKIIADFLKVPTKNKPNTPQVDGVSLKKKEDIGKKTFVEEILAWAIDAMKELKKLAKDNTPILVTNVKAEYSTLLKTYAINQYLCNEICKVLPDSLQPATRANASAKIIGYLSSLTKENLEKLFKENKTIRQDLTDDKSLKTNILPASSTFYDILMLNAVEDKENEMHPEKIAEAEKAKAEAEKAKAEAEKDNIIKSWIQAEYDTLKATTFEVDAITACDTFRENLAIFLGSSNIQSLFCEGIDEKEQNTNEVKNILLTNLADFLAQKRLSEDFMKYAAHFAEFKQKTKILVVLKSNQKLTKGVIFEDFIAAFEKWKVKREGMFEKIDKKWKLDKVQLKKELAAIFIDESAFLYKDLLSPMIDKTTDATLHLDKKLFMEKSSIDFASIWKEMFAKCDETYLASVYANFKKMGKTDAELRNYISVLDVKFPDYDIIWTALETSRSLDPKIKVPATTEGLSTEIIINYPKETDKGFIGMNVNMPLIFKPFDLGEGLIFHPIVLADKISIDQKSSGSLSFLNATTRVFNVKSEKGIGVTYTVEIKLSVKDSSQVLNANTTESGGVDISVSVGPIGIDPSLSSETPIKGKVSATGGSFDLYIYLDVKSERAVKPDYINVFCYNANLGTNDYGLNINAMSIRKKTRLELKNK